MQICWANNRIRLTIMPSKSFLNPHLKLILIEVSRHDNACYRTCKIKSQTNVNNEVSYKTAVFPSESDSLLREWNPAEASLHCRQQIIHTDLSTLELISHQ